MPDFPHLPLPKKISAPHKFRGLKIDTQTSQITLANLENRKAHGRQLKQATNELTREWQNKVAVRRREDLPGLPSEDVIPIFLRVDTYLFDADSLFSMGIEVIAEDEDGYIIGATTDNFTGLKEKIDKFIANQGKYKNKAAQLWDIILGDQWRLDYILSPELSEKWDRIPDDVNIVVDISVACAIKVPAEPAMNDGEAKRAYDTRYARWQERKQKLEHDRDDLEIERQTELETFINSLNGAIISSFVNFSDSFSCRVELTGQALKDLVLNYQYLFDVTEYESFRYVHQDTGEDIVIDATVNAPSPDSPKICIIDSGIQEGHRLLSPAIDGDTSRSYLPNNTSTADEVSNGGHGTKVAGAVLYGNNIPKTGNHNLNIILRNARILNSRNFLPKELFPPALMENIVEDFPDCKVFNLSINSNHPSKSVHMSQWASAIDKIINEADVLFVVSTGNISGQTGRAANPGISEHLNARRSYPEYLLTRASRIANPAQSCFAITVGSVCCDTYDDPDKRSFGARNDPSAFTRTGPGIWRMIKPDVVEYGGDFIREKGANPNISQLPVTSTEVVRTTTGGGNAVGYDNGSSYATPKVSHIAGQILNEIPDASANLMRTLIVQSARLPNDKFRRPQFNDIYLYGYGIPDANRATENSERRITMIAEGDIFPKQAQIYTVKVPDEIRRAGNEFDVLVEVSLAFTAVPRRTRRRTNSYLSAWVDWQSSKFDESYNQFKNRITKYVEGEPVEALLDESDSEDNIKWNIRENVNWGTVKNIRRQDSSLQKDWTILKAYSLPQELSFAVVGHKGWEKDIRKSVPFSLVVSFEVLNAEVDIYNLIRIENQIEIEVRV
jgi:hypothetical protein